MSRESLFVIVISKSRSRALISSCWMWMKTPSKPPQQPNFATPKKLSYLTRFSCVNWKQGCTITREDGGIRHRRNLWISNSFGQITVDYAWRGNRCAQSFTSYPPSGQSFWTRLIDLLDIQRSQLSLSYTSKLNYFCARQIGQPMFCL